MDNRLKSYFKLSKNSEVCDSKQSETLELIKQIKKQKADIKEKFLIIDGMNLFIRNWTVVPTMNADGAHIGGTLGFLRSLKVLIRENIPTKVIVVWDGHGGSAKRRKLYSDYKAGRKPRVNRQYDFETPEEQLHSMHRQYELTKRYVELLGITQIEVEAVEADDIIALLCKYMLGEVAKLIVTSDKDMLQLVDNKTIVYSPTKKIYFKSQEVKEKTGVIPENYVYMKAFLGDSSDNIHGIKGFGEKTVLKFFPFLADKETTLQEILSYAERNSSENIKYKIVVDNKEVLLKNIELMQLSVPIISPQSVRTVKEILDKENIEFIPTEVRLLLSRDGMQIEDMDFFSVFKEYHLRVSKETVNV